MQEFALKIKERKSSNNQRMKRLESVTLKSALVDFFQIEVAHQELWRENTRPHYITKPNFKKIFKKCFSFFPMLLQNLDIILLLIAYVQQRLLN